MTTRAQRNALRTDERVRERLPTLADALDRVHAHEAAQGAFVEWWAFVVMTYSPEAIAELRALPGFSTLDQWMHNAREDEPAPVEGRAPPTGLEDM